MPRLTGSSAVLLVADVERSAEYYRERLGFTCEIYGDPPDFIVAKRDEAIILMALCDDAERIVPNWRIVDNVWNVYVRVDDVEAIYAELRRRGAPSDYTLYDAPSGFREFGVQDPDGHDIGIGQPLEHDSGAAA
jgi:catechol 2,3-dioxygenase-like lactoylglutathione lyase family enzyme